MSTGSMSETAEHKLVQSIRMANGDWRTECSCGAHWSNDSKRSPEYLQSIFDSHVGYSKHEAIKPL